MRTISSRVCVMLTALILICAMLMSMSGCTVNTDTSTDNISNTSSTSNTNSSANANNTESTKSTYPTQLYDREGNPIQMPDDNDEEGWFSVEVLTQYSAPSFIQPENSVVTSKPLRDLLYLQGDEDTFRDAVIYAYATIKGNNRAVYLPVLSVGEDGIAEVSALDQISTFDTSNLYPKGDETSVTFIYLCVHDLYECSISLENLPGSDDKQIRISFTERTDLYGDLI